LEERSPLFNIKIQPQLGGSSKIKEIPPVILDKNHKTLSEEDLIQKRKEKRFQSLVV